MTCNLAGVVAQQHWEAAEAYNELESRVSEVNSEETVAGNVEVRKFDETSLHTQFAAVRFLPINKGSCSINATLMLQYCNLPAWRNS